MVKRHNHYEAAFEDFLRTERIPYIAVNEQRRALECKGSLKNLDFIISPDTGLHSNDDGSIEGEDSMGRDHSVDRDHSIGREHSNGRENYDEFDSYPNQASGQSPTCPVEMQWLIDIKGRRFPSGSQYWRNWTTRDELDSLDRWRNRFGNGFDAALIFSYQLVGNRSPVPIEQLHFFRDQAYAFLAVRLYDYWAVSKTLSPSWGTVSVPVAEFRRIAQPLGELLGARPMGKSPLSVS